MISTRFVILILLLAVASKTTLIPYFLPYGSAVWISRGEYTIFGKVDPTNVSLRLSSGNVQRIVERILPNDTKPELLKGPETVVVDPDGQVYILSEEAKLVKLSKLEAAPNDPNTFTAETTLVVDLGVGRPLGGAFVPDSNNETTSFTLYVADAILGLLRVTNIPRADQATSIGQPRVELVASRVQMVDGSWSQFAFADDVAIGPKTGHVYFTDATHISPDRIDTKTWDTLGASVVDFTLYKKTGRLLRYKPESNEVDILAEGIHFANGVAVVDSNEQSLVVSETFGVRMLEYDLTSGTIKPLEMEPLVGTPDGADCSHSTGLCYAAIATSEPAFSKVLSQLPPNLHQALRTLTLMLPKSLRPKPVPYGCFVEFDPKIPKVTRIIQDPTGQDLRLISGVTVHGNTLYLGSLNNNVVGVYKLS